MLKNKNTLDWVQLLRGVAAFLVVLTHARYAFYDTPAWGMAESVFRPGAMGVDLFFIISGFIMAHSTAKSDGSLAYVLGFAIKRFARIWPVYAVVTLIWLVANYEGLDFFRNPGNLKVLAKSLAFLPVNPAYPPFFNMALPPGWTLAFEMYFYAIFGVCLLFKRLRWFVLIAWMALTIFILPLGHRGLNMDVMVDPGFSFSYLNLASNPIILEFLAGVLIAKLYQAKWATIGSAYVCYNLLAMSFAFATWYIYAGVQDFHGPVKWGWPLAILVLVMAISSKTITITAPRFVLWLGTISFSLYLTHTVTQHVVTALIIKSHWTQNIHSWGHVFLITVFSLPVAAASHHYLELGLSEAMRKWLLKLVPAPRAGIARAAGDAQADASEPPVGRKARA